LKEQKQVEQKKKQAEQIKQTISKLKREVLLQFDSAAIFPTLQKAMEKHGKIENFVKTPIGIRCRFENELSVQKALKAKKLFVRLPVPILPAEIKHHAVYFHAPEDMGDLDQEILNQIEAAMSSHGSVAMVKKKGRNVVIQFNDKDTRDGLVSVEGNSEVTIEIGDHSVALHAGLPPTFRKRRKMEKKAKEDAKKALELARASGQPPPPKQLKSE